jgi:hypothetical protein
VAQARGDAGQAANVYESLRHVASRVRMAGKIAPVDEWAADLGA